MCDRRRSWPGIMAALMVLGLHLAWADNRAKSAHEILAAGAFGLVAESLLAAGGLVHYAAAWPSPLLAPAWIVALWLAFAVTLDPMRALLGSYALAKATLLGGALGP